MITGEFQYLGSDDTTIRKHSYKYDDKWLLKPSTEKNFDLLKFAYYLSLAPSLKENILNFYDQLGYSYTAKIDYQKEGLNVLAGDKVTDSVYYPAPIVKGKLYINSIGYAIGYKQVENSTIILVAVRGGHYGSEWGGNFNIGTGTDVAGFKIASDQVLDGIKNTIKTNNFTGDIKILISGYSRAASTANLTAARLTQGEIPGIPKENIFGFSIECPRDTRDQEALTDKYNNIISISNPNDLIPKVAESVFGYRRYGKTYYTAGVENDKNFKEKFMKMKIEEKSIVPFQFMPSFDTGYIQNVFVNDFAFVFKNLENYVNKYQSCLELLTAVFFGGAKQEVPQADFILIDRVQKELYYINPLNITKISKYLGSEPKMVFKLNFMSPILQNHAMELNLSWLESLNSYEDFSSSYSKILYIYGAKKVKIRDENKNILAEVDGNTINNQENALYLSYDNNGQLIVQFNPQQTFDIEIAPLTDSVVVNYARFDMQKGLKDKLVNFGKVDASSLVELTVPEGEDTNPIIKTNGKEISSNIIEESDLKYYTVRMNLNEYGKVTGGGYFTQGEICRLTVADEVKDSFKGWAINNKVVSKDPVYSFTVTESVEIEPQFK